MRTMDWAMVAALVASIALVGLGFAAFWPEWPPIEPGVHRATQEAPRPAPVPEARPLPLGPTADEWIWSTEEAKRGRPRHRHQDLGEGTQPLRWYDVPGTGEQPIHPKL